MHYLDQNCMQAYKQGSLRQFANCKWLELQNCCICYWANDWESKVTNQLYTGQKQVSTQACIHLYLTWENIDQLVLPGCLPKANIYCLQDLCWAFGRAECPSFKSNHVTQPHVNGSWSCLQLSCAFYWLSGAALHVQLYSSAVADTVFFSYRGTQYNCPLG